MNMVELATMFWSFVFGVSSSFNSKPETQNPVLSLVEGSKLVLGGKTRRLYSNTQLPASAGCRRLTAEGRRDILTHHFTRDRRRP